jgi:hypothetical protein
MTEYPLTEEQQACIDSDQPCPYGCDCGCNSGAYECSHPDAYEQAEIDVADGKYPDVESALSARGILHEVMGVSPDRREP